MFGCSRTPIVKLPWIPGISPKLKRVYKKAGYKTVFKGNANLQTILTSKNKVLLPKNSHSGVYKIQHDLNNMKPMLETSIGKNLEQTNTRNHAKLVLKT